jgi:ribosomal protein L37AE/L43A
MPKTPLAPNTVAAKHAEATDWTICHFCKRYGRCERWFKSWRCSDCSAAHMPPAQSSGVFVRRSLGSYHAGIEAEQRRAT